MNQIMFATINGGQAFAVALGLILTALLVWAITRRHYKEKHDQTLHEERLTSEGRLATAGREHTTAVQKLRDENAQTLGDVVKQHASTLQRMGEERTREVEQLNQRIQELFTQLGDAETRGYERCAKQIGGRAVDVNDMKLLPTGRYPVRTVVSLPAMGVRPFEFLVEGPVGIKDGHILVRIPPPGQEVPTGAFDLVVTDVPCANRRYRFHFEERNGGTTARGSKAQSASAPASTGP